MKNTMRKSYLLLVIYLVLFSLLLSCSGDPLKESPMSDKKIEEPDRDEEELIDEEDQENGEEEIVTVDIEEEIKYLEEKYGDRLAKSWGEDVEGVINRISTEDKVISLTFDACGSKNDGFDKEIIDYLIEKEIPASLFINYRWIDQYPDEFMDLANNDLFEIANHGYQHRPLSINGQSAYDIRGTENIREVVEEIQLNDEKIHKLTGEKPKYFRSGTAYYDEVAVEIANQLGYKVINYNVLGDAGATFTKEQIIASTSKAESGSIILFHMNKPEKKIAEGIIEGINILLEEGYSFVRLSDYDEDLR